MTEKQFSLARLIIVIILAMTISVAVIQENYYLAVIAMFTGMIVMLGVKRRVKDILADERDYRLAGKAATLSLYLYSLAGTIGGFILLVLSKNQPSLKEYAYLIFYSVCALMILNSSLFNYYRRKGDQ